MILLAMCFCSLLVKMAGIYNYEERRKTVSIFQQELIQRALRQHNVLLLSSLHGIEYVQYLAPRVDAISTKYCGSLSYSGVRTPFGPKMNLRKAKSSGLYYTWWTAWRPGVRRKWGGSRLLPSAFVLPSTHFGGDLYMRQDIHDVIAISNLLGHSGMFLTITCNPTWSVITRALFLWQNPEDQPDISALVFA